jgi:hypothetical protein
MQLSQILNFDTPYEHLKDGDLVHAGNVMIDKDTQTIQNEPGLKDFYIHGVDANIVGHIECNQEFVLFFDNSQIYRVNVDGSNPKLVDIRWHWCGGQVFGTYTYNVNNELIVCISEQNPTEDCPLKSINLDKDKDLNPYITDGNDELYTELATAPISNFGDVSFVNGSRIKKGTYIFFIRYWIDDYYKTIWFPIGYPVHVTDIAALQTPKTVFSYSGNSTVGSGSIQDYYNKDDDYTNTNPQIQVRIYTDTIKAYNKYQLGAIINGNASTEAVVWKAKSITALATFDIDNNFETISLDELTNEPFNFYNVKALDDYRNRVYLGNYKIANKNSVFEKHKDYLNEQMAKVVISAVDRREGSYPTSAEAINFFKPKPGRRGIYTFFIHYVYPNGTYTDGYPINTINNGANNVDGVNLKVERITLANGESLYRYSCPTDLLYLGGVVFEHLPMLEGFVGYFISYEQPKYADVGSGFITKDDKSLYDVKGEQVGGSNFRFNYPEFSIIGGSTNANKISDTCLFNLDTVNDNLNAILTYNSKADEKITGIEKTEVIPPNSYSNRGKEGALRISTANQASHTRQGLVLSDIYTDDITDFYVDVDKNLISLGYIEYVKDVVTDGSVNYTYGSLERRANNTTVYPVYAWNYYWNLSTVYTYHSRGIIFSDVNWNPYDATDNTEFFKEGNTVANKPLLYSFTFVHESHYFLMGKKMNISPRTLYYNISSGETNTQVANLIIDASRINDLYVLDANYYNYYRRIIVNYNKKNDLYKKEFYGKTVYRTDVIGDESIANSWKHISPEAYKIISENKGDITNIVGIDTYLLVHTEKSLFAFNINNQLKTTEQDVQMLMPDVFEVEYKEMFSSKYGIAGFQDFVSYIVGDFGYIFYDRNSKKLYNFNGSNIEDIDGNISKFIHTFNADYIYMGYDTANARLMFNFIKENKSRIKQSCIFSYSLYNNNWISTHSYTSDYKFITLKDNFYIVDKIQGMYRIREFDNENYNEYNDDNLNPFMNNEVIDDKLCSYVDVYFNNNNSYNTIKILNFITYIINKEKNDNFDVLGCYIYTNCCYSDYCNLLEERKSIAEYKKPYLEYGRWNYNWFSNKLNSFEEQEIVNRITGIINDNLEYNQTAVDAKLIVGKYCVIRFVFRNTNKKVLIKDIQAYFNK